MNNIYFTVVDRHIELYRSARLYILLCTSAMVICQVAALAAKLHSSRYLLVENII
jgi:hypothetical protein